MVRKFLYLIALDCLSCFQFKFFHHLQQVREIVNVYKHIKLRCTLKNILMKQVACRRGTHGKEMREISGQQSAKNKGL